MEHVDALASWPRKVFTRLLLRPERLTLPLSALRCNDKPIARQQGYGGQPIESFPVYGFFRLYLERPEAAYAAFHGWYREWFVERQGWRHPKSEGGLAGGSLQRAVEGAHYQRHRTLLASPGAAEAEVVERAIDERVRHYFAVLESIRDAGFDADRKPPVLAVRAGDFYFLRNGHHRCAALAALGHRSVTLSVVHPLRAPRRPSIGGGPEADAAP
jgi:hypothetical protein